jgi:hypothetical protein
MNFTTLDHIREIINDGAIYWTLRDRNNSAILAEQTAAISAGDSYDKLTRNIKEMRGDFVKLSLSARNPAEKNAGGNVKSYGPYNIEIQNVGNAPAAIGAPPVYHQSGPTWPEHNNTVDALRREIADLKWENRELQRDIREAQKSDIKYVVSQVLPAIFPDQKKAPEISGAGVPVTFEDQQTAQHVFNLSQRPKFNEVVKKLDENGMLGWAMVLDKLIIEENAVN